jgi:hypothetical protein
MPSSPRHLLHKDLDIGAVADSQRYVLDCSIVSMLVVHVQKLA